MQRSRYLNSSVPDPGISRIPDPEFYPSRIPDFGSRIQQQNQKRREEEFFCPTIFCSDTYHKNENNLIFEQVNKFFKGKTLKIIFLPFLPKHLSLRYQKHGFGIRDLETTYSGSRIQGQKGTGFRIRNTPNFNISLWWGGGGVASCLKAAVRVSRAACRLVEEGTERASMKASCPLTSSSAISSPRNPKQIIIASCVLSYKWRGQSGPA
jgi:hypothetical protein